MNDYMVLVKGGYKEHAAMSEEDKNAYYEKWGVYVDRLVKKGIFVGGGPLKDEGTVITGSFENQKSWEVEPDKSVGGYIILKAESQNAAIEEVRDCPIFMVNGTAVVRQVEEM